MDIIDLAEKEREKNFIFGAVGFETTIPVYTLLLDEIIRKDIKNVKLLTALKCMVPVVDHLLEGGAEIDGFIAPGHVSVIIGSDAFGESAKKYGVPFAVTGFSDEELIAGIYGLVRMCENGINDVRNFYTSVVTKEGNERALQKMNYYFEPADTVWRGMGEVKLSGLYLKDEFRRYDAGSKYPGEDKKLNKACICDKVLMGKKRSEDCPLFSKECTPLTPQGACMVSCEGSCYAHYISYK